MCPACISNAALIVTGAVSAGGWTAFALRSPRAPRGSRPQEKVPDQAGLPTQGNQDKRRD